MAQNSITFIIPGQAQATRGSASGDRPPRKAWPAW